ncbi:MAG: type II toxin-antitoxin system HicA family toxin [Chloroflexota bacterium]|nr:type II toxin-antitoxin system HicA family toxin [Chloroflexota bacterium]
MPPIAPIKRRDLIRYLRELEATGPYPGGQHEFMRRDGKRIILPNTHQGDISRGLLARILRDAGISREEWERL